MKVSSHPSSTLTPQRRLRGTAALQAPVIKDTVELNSNSHQSLQALDNQLGKLFDRYRSSNSRHEQGAISSEIQNLFSGSYHHLNGPLKKAESRLRGVFQKTEAAWNRQEALKLDPIDSEFEWNVRRHELAQARPMKGDNFFQLSDVKTHRNLLSMLSFSEYRAQQKQINGGITDDRKPKSFGSITNDRKPEYYGGITDDRRQEYYGSITDDRKPKYYESSNIRAKSKAPKG